MDLFAKDHIHHANGTPWLNAMAFITLVPKIDGG